MEALTQSVVKVIQITPAQADWIMRGHDLFVSIPYHKRFLECEPNYSLSAIETSLSYEDKETVANGDVESLMWFMGVLLAHKDTDWLIMTIPKDDQS